MAGFTGSLSSIDVCLIDENCFRTTKQIRFPRTRKRRIRKKWAQRPENYRTVSTWKRGTNMRMGDRFYTDAETLVKIRALASEFRSTYHI